jgi:hypothetical protein
MAEKEIVATNAHILIKFEVDHNFNGIYNVNYVPTIDGIKANDKKPEVIEDRYPQYNAVIPKNNPISSILDVKKCLAFIQYVDKSGYLNKVTRQMAFLNEHLVENGGDSPYIYFNAYFFIEVLKTFLSMGITQVNLEMSTSIRAVVLRSDNDSYRVTALMMPYLDKEIENYEYREYGDRENGKVIRANYDLINNVILSNDRSFIDYVDISQKKSDVRELSDEEIKIIKSFLKQNNTLPILGYVLIKDKKLHITDLEKSIIIDGIDRPDGLYELVGESLIKVEYPENYEYTKQSPDEYPIIKSDLNYYTSIGSIDSAELKAKISVSRNFYAKEDQYNKSLEGLHFFNYMNDTYISASNAAIVYVDKIETGLLDIKEDESIIVEFSENVELLLNDDEVKIYENKDNIIFSFDKYTYVGKKIHGNDRMDLALKRTYEMIIEGKSEYFDCVSVDKKTIDEIFKVAKEEKRNGIDVGFTINVDKKKIILYSGAREVGFERSIDVDGNNGLFETGIFIMPRVDVSERNVYRVEYLKKALNYYPCEEFHMCKLSNFHNGNTLYIPAPKFEGLKVSDDKKKKIEQRINEVSEIAKIKQDEILKEPKEEEDNIEEKISEYKQRIELIQEMIFEETDSDKIDSLIERGEIIVEMIGEYESNFNVSFLREKEENYHEFDQNKERGGSINKKYYNYRRTLDELDEEIVFCSDNPEDSRHYGNYQRIFVATERTDALHKEVIKHASEFYKIDEKESELLINPVNIVTSAGAWDDVEFINYLYEDTDYFIFHDGIITNNGAVFFEVNNENLVETNVLDDNDNIIDKITNKSKK